MERALETTKIGAGDFEGQVEDVYDYDIPNAKTGKLLGSMSLRGFGQPTLDRYRDIRNGDGRRKGDEPKAREFIFKKTYVRFTFAQEDDEQGNEAARELDLAEGEKEVDFFLKKCPKVVDAVVIKHLANVFPDVDTKKLQTQLD